MSSPRTGALVFAVSLLVFPLYAVKAQTRADSRTPTIEARDDDSVDDPLRAGFGDFGVIYYHRRPPARPSISEPLPVITLEREGSLPAATPSPSATETPLPLPALPPVPIPSIAPTVIPHPSLPPLPPPAVRPTPAFPAPPPNPAPVLPLPNPPQRAFALAGPDRFEIQLLTPSLEVWRSGAASPQVPTRSDNYLATAYVPTGEAVFVRLQFNPLAAGRTVVVRPGRAAIVEPAVAALQIGPTGICQVNVRLADGAPEGHLSFHCEGRMTTLRLLRAASAFIATRENSVGGIAR